MRRQLDVTGRVQGVGFRPFAARLATSLDLAGTVSNTGDGVRIVIEGESAALDAFLDALRGAPPSGASIDHIAIANQPSRGARSFAITASDADAAIGARVRIPPDVPLCAACLADLFDPASRRHRYPFTHCATCGPRAAVIEALPYDRERTSLRHFPLCNACRSEYDDSTDRRHHAQSIACPACGPALCALSPSGDLLAGDPIERAARMLRSGGIVA